MTTTTSYTVVLHKSLDDHHFGVYISDDIPSGVYVVTVVPNSPAAKANIRPGDRVLAINGQLLSTMSTSPKKMIEKIANNAESLTLSIQSSTILNVIGEVSSNNFHNNNYQSSSKQNKDIDQNLKNYLKSILGNENFQDISVLPSSPNEYILTPNQYSYRPHRHRKRRSLKTVETQTSIIDERKENSPRRSIPSMGTSHVALRNSQPSSKDSEITDVSEVKSSPDIHSFVNIPNYNINENAVQTSRQISSPIQSLDSSPQLSSARVSIHEGLQSKLPVSNRPPSIASEGLHEIHLRRSPNFQGFGFHLQYNKIYYIIHHIEPNSPSEFGGLQPNDIILRINNQTTEKMPHKTFVQTVSSNTEVVFLVQSYDNYIRMNPQVLQQQTNRPNLVANDNNNKNTGDGRKNVLSKALSKITSR